MLTKFEKEVYTDTITGVGGVGTIQNVYLHLFTGIAPSRYVLGTIIINIPYFHIVLSANKI